MASDGGKGSHRVAWAVGVAVPLACAVALVIWLPTFSDPAPAPEPEPEPVPAQLPTQPPTSQRRVPVAQPRPAAPVAEPTTQEAPMPTETPSGIGLFNPPGTKPIKIGIVVPENFELPPGYVRHFQIMDDGRELPAVLMFHPDAHPKDANGNPVAMPADRIVPPELAPPGLPIEYLKVPEPLADEESR